jgi:hypothetical protein
MGLSLLNVKLLGDALLVSETTERRLAADGRCRV